MITAIVINFYIGWKFTHAVEQIGAVSAVFFTALTLVAVSYLSVALNLP